MALIELSCLIDSVSIRFTINWQSHAIKLQSNSITLDLFLTQKITEAKFKFTDESFSRKIREVEQQKRFERRLSSTKFSERLISKLSAGFVKYIFTQPEKEKNGKRWACEGNTSDGWEKRAPENDVKPCVDITCRRLHISRLLHANNKQITWPVLIAKLSLHVTQFHPVNNAVNSSAFINNAKRHRQKKIARLSQLTAKSACKVTNKGETIDASFHSASPLPSLFAYVFRRFSQRNLNGRGG